MSYKLVALKAAELAGDKKVNPVDAWERCAKNEYPNKPLSEKKGCPKNAFLGLCAEGYVKGVAAGNYTSSVDNKRYARNAIEVLVTNKNRKFNAVELWREILKKETDKTKTHNSQMSVVIALWENGFIKT